MSAQLVGHQVNVAASVVKMHEPKHQRRLLAALLFLGSTVHNALKFTNSGKKLQKRAVAANPSQKAMSVAVDFIPVHAFNRSSNKRMNARLTVRWRDIKERIAVDSMSLTKELAFVDDGYSGDVLVRPALEQLRDRMSAGAIDRIYVHSPDRLARKYAYHRH